MSESTPAGQVRLIAQLSALFPEATQPVPAPTPKMTSLPAGVTVAQLDAAIGRISIGATTAEDFALIDKFWPGRVAEMKASQAKHAAEIAGVKREIAARNSEIAELERKIAERRADTERIHTASEGLRHAETFAEAQPHLAALQAHNPTLISNLAKQFRIKDACRALEHCDSLKIAAPHLAELQKLHPESAKVYGRLVENRMFDMRKLGIMPDPYRDRAEAEKAALSTPATKLAFYQQMPAGREKDEFRQKHFADLIAAETDGTGAAA